MDFKHFSISDVGRVRQANEDNCGDRMTANGYVCVVCDGMGGHVGGATASDIAVESILSFFENPVQNIFVGISDAFKFANSQVFNAAISNPELKGMGTTGTILVINNDACYVGHVGDSRIYLKSDGKLNRLTKDHSFVQTLVDQGIISDEDAESHPKKNQILEALGIKPEVNASVCEAPIHPKPGDCFLLCSDGLNGMIKDREIEKLIDSETIETSCRALIDSANNAGGNDNITATLVSITESPYAQSVFKHFNPVIGAATTIIEPIGTLYGAEPKRRLLPWIGGGIGLVLGVFAIWFFFLRNEKVAEPDKDDVVSPIHMDESGQTEEKDSNDIEIKNVKRPIPNSSQTKSTKREEAAKSSVKDSVVKTEESAVKDSNLKSEKTPENKIEDVKNAEDKKTIEAPVANPSENKDKPK